LSGGGKVRMKFSRRRHFALPLIAALALAALATPAHAGTDRWTPFGPGDGRLRSLIASSRGELYVTSNYTAGEIWQRLTQAALWRWRGEGLGLPRVTALAVHPKNPNALWAVSSDAEGSPVQSVFRSTDGGASWRLQFTGDVDFQIVRLTVAPTAHSVVLLAETGPSAPRRLLRSADLGVSWTEVPEGLGPIAAAPDDPGTIYAVAASGFGVVKSIDGGKSFRPTGGLPVEEGDEIRALHATSGRPALVLASLSLGGLFRSTNGGGAWRRCGFAHSGPSAIASEPTHPRKIYAVNVFGLYASDLGGQSGSFRTLATFSFFPILGFEPESLVAAPGGPYFLTDGDLYRFTAPQGFEPVAKSGIEAFGVAELRISPVDPSFLALRRHTGCTGGFCDDQTLLSTDGGATFTRLGAQISARRFLDVTDLAFDPTDPRRWLLSLSAGFVLLHNAGEPDLLGQTLLTGPEQTVEFTAGGALLAGGSDGIRRSENLGATWATPLGGTFSPDPEHPFPGFRRIVDLATNPYAPERVIARSLEFISGLPHDPGRIVLYKSADAGRTWSWLRDGEADVEFVPGAPASLFLLFSTPDLTELDRSDDFGETSTRLRTFDLFDQVSDLATDPNGSSDLYAASRFGVLRSRDGGAGWDFTAGGFAPFGGYRRPLSRVQVFPGQAGRLIASPSEGGLFENRLSN
jgi:hypothetical protein